MALECRSVIEVVPRVPMYRPVAAPPALAGFFDYRGTLLPVVDLHSLLLERPCPPERAARIAVVGLQGNRRHRMAGLLAEGFTRLIAGDAPQQAALDDPGRPYVGGWVRAETGTVQLVVAERLLGEAWLDMLLGPAPDDAATAARSGAAS